MPTIPSPDTVIRQVSLMEEIPFMAFPSHLASSASRVAEMSVPGAEGLNVFLIRIGIFLWNTGYIVGGYTTFAPKLHNSIASTNVRWSMT